jgi:uncharacterized protein
MILYIHGFNSSPDSHKAQQLKAYLEERGRGGEFACPQLPHRPAAAMALLQDLVHGADGSTKLIGSSLGGFYATWLTEQYGLKAALVNPAVHADQLLKDALGPQRNFYTGETYEFTEQHLKELARFDLPTIVRPDLFLLLVEQGDEVLDYRQAVDYYRGARQIVLEGGDHGFSRFGEYIETILAF